MHEILPIVIMMKLDSYVEAEMTLTSGEIP
jgi:hypothetical protein